VYRSSVEVIIWWKRRKNLWLNIVREKKQETRTKKKAVNIEIPAFFIVIFSCRLAILLLAAQRSLLYLFICVIS
jgi:hypothetical protein